MKKKVLTIVISLILYSNLAFTPSAKLDTQEVKLLQQIGEKLGIAGTKVWDLNKDPCIGEGNWGIGEYRKGFNVSIVCDCSFEPNATCHAVHIYIKSQNISAALPSEFSKLRYLRILDLSRNYLNGTIPSAWATMQLYNLSLMGNQLSGPFPKVLTRMTTLRDLSLEGNRFSGPIPPTIANLKNLERLILTSNDFTGELPPALGKLTNMTDMRISDNNFTGKIPNFISQWTKIGKLHIQGCSLEGPIPSSISVLTQLNDLRISDLKRGASSFPLVQNMTQLNKLWAFIFV